MRPLTEDETKMVFEKLYKFIGKNIKNLIDRPDEPHCFRLQKNRVFYVRESLMKRATNVRCSAQHKQAALQGLLRSRGWDAKWCRAMVSVLCCDMLCR